MSEHGRGMIKGFDPPNEMELSIRQAASDNINRAPADPHRIGDITVQAVSQIGNDTAQHIEQVAASVEAAGKATADSLRKLAEELRKHSTSAEERIKGFVDMANLTRENIDQLGTFIQNGGKAAGT